MGKKIAILNDIGTFNSGSLFENAIQNNFITAYDRATGITELRLKKKRGRKPKERIYFSQKTEDAIIRYNNSTCPIERDRIYTDDIRFSFEKLAENMINTFKFEYISDSYSEMQCDVVSHMLLNIDKYEQAKGKAFSYFSIIAKNYLIVQNDTAYAMFKSTRSINQISSDANEQFDIDIVDNEYYNEIDRTEMAEFIEFLVQYFTNNMYYIFKKERDRQIASAILILFKRVDYIKLFQKKLLYALVKEICRHESQYITRVINKMSKYYPKIRNEYLEFGFIRSDSSRFF